MTQILSGKDVAASLKEKNKVQSARLRAQGCLPSLAIVRVGERPDDVYYENSIIKNCAAVDIDCRTYVLPSDVEQKKLNDTLSCLAGDEGVSGIFFFSPLPSGLDETAARALIPPQKDVDSLSRASAAGLYAGDPGGFAPCTPAAVMEILQYYGVRLAGARVTVVGRSLVVGKPLALLLLAANATVTIAHSRTEALPELCREAHILVAAMGKPRFINASFVRTGQTVIDVGINADPQDAHKICGDVDFAAVSPLVDKITPVPGGVGSVTVAVLMSHVLTAAAKLGGLR